MKRGPSTGNQTKSEAVWIDTIKRAGCICCDSEGFTPDSDSEPPLVEAHHLLSGGIRRGHLFSLGLCAWHHRGRAIDAAVIARRWSRWWDAYGARVRLFGNDACVLEERMPVLPE